MKIVADPNIPFVREAFGPLGDVQLVPGRQMTPATVREAELLLVRSVTPVNAALLDGSRVRFVATATIGTDHVDEAHLVQRGIGFASAAGSNANSVAEYIVAALLELGYQGKTLGVVGVGNVGSKVVRYATALGMRVLQNDPPRQRAEKLPEFVTLDRIGAEADIITFHVPLTKSGPDATFHLFEPRGGIIINTSRGAVLDNQALLTAPLAGLVLDVWEGEPTILPALLEKADFGTPHIAGYSFDGKVNGTRMIYEAACRHFGLSGSWKPELPAPANPVLTGHNLRSVVRQAYDITADDAALRRDYRHFDRLRAEYPVRREFFNYATSRSEAAALGFRPV
jgi:erythronate-4-phosphate dehydrogenase